MELFFTPLTCSIAPRIALYEADLDAQYTHVILQTKTLKNGDSYNELNPRSTVPALRLNDDELMTDIIAILQYIADQAPNSGLAPSPDAKDRYLLQSWLGFIAVELHKQIIWPQFAPNVPQDMKSFALDLAPLKLSYLQNAIEGRQYLLGDAFTVVDTYLVWALTVLRHLGVDLSHYPALDAYFSRTFKRPSVLKAFSEERTLSESLT